MLQTKIKLFEELKKLVDNQITTSNTEIKRLKDARNNETKSSVGDKYETGRAMMQIELAKMEDQLRKAYALQLTLSSIDIAKTHERAALGSLIFTEKATYFLSIGMGKMNIDNSVFYAISPASPIGQLLLGKKAGEKYTFLNKTVEILKIV